MTRILAKIAEHHMKNKHSSIETFIITLLLNTACPGLNKWYRKRIVIKNY